MTYAGLKSFLYAGVGKDDPRVKAAIGWVRRHYTLSENPGQGQADSGALDRRPLGAEPLERDEDAFQVSGWHSRPGVSHRQGGLAGARRRTAVCGRPAARLRAENRRRPEAPRGVRGDFAVRLRPADRRFDH